jgi:hypothetical protein
LLFLEIALSEVSPFFDDKCDLLWHFLQISIEWV